MFTKAGRSCQASSCVEPIVESAAHTERPESTMGTAMERKPSSNSSKQSAYPCWRMESRLVNKSSRPTSVLGVFFTSALVSKSVNNSAGGR